MNRTLVFTDGRGFEVAATLGDSHCRVTRLDGWYGSETETEWTRRLGDGQIAGAMWRTQRKIALGIRQYFATDAEVNVQARRVAGLFESGREGQGTVSMEHDGEWLTALSVALDGAPRVSRSMGARILDWEVELISPDPYLYGPLQRVQIPSPGVGVGLRYPQHENGYLDYGEAYTGPAPEVTNEGNQVAYPVIEVSGSMPSGFRLDLVGDISRPGAGVTFRGDVDAGHPVIVDFWTGRVARGDVDQSYLLTRRDWGGISPGGIASVTLASLGQGEGWADLSVRSTFA